MRPKLVGHCRGLPQWAAWVIMVMMVTQSRTGIVSEITAVNFRQNLGEMLTRVQYRRDSVVISKDGKPVAALVDAALFERIRRLQNRFDALCSRLEAGYAGVPEEDGMAEIDGAVRAERTLPPAKL